MSESFIQHSVVGVLSILISILPVIFMGKIFFGDWDTFIDCSRLIFQPEWLSIMRGELDQINMEWLRTSFFYILVFLTPVATFKILIALFIGSPPTSQNEVKSPTLREIVQEHNKVKEETQGLKK